MKNYQLTAVIALLFLICALLIILAWQNRSPSSPQAAVTASGQIVEAPPSILPPAAPRRTNAHPSSNRTPLEPVATEAASLAEASATIPPRLVPLRLELPDAAFTGTPTDIPLSAYTEPYPENPRPPFMAPPELTNVAPGKALTSSDTNAIRSLSKITDGDKSPSEDSIIFVRKGTQWVQIDLGEPHELFAVVLWHAHNFPKIYHDVIVLAGGTEDFSGETRTLFNNDQDNSSGLGVGSDREYFENYEGRLINPKGIEARYLRFYSRGSTESALNEYTEIEIYARKPGIPTNAEEHNL